MKNITSLLLTLFCVFLGFSQSFNYQAVVKDASGTLLINQSIGVKVGLIEGSAVGTLLYTETHTINTNANGVLSLAIGTGTTTDNFSAINWSTQNHWLEIAVDITGGSSYTVIGTSQLLSVPYAMAAETVKQGDDLGNHSASQLLNLNDNDIIGVKTVNSNTLVASNGNTIKNTVLTGNENLIIPGPTSDYVISVQDGNGRVQHKWNATHGVSEKFIVGGEDAAFIDIKATAANDTAPWLEFKHADGAIAVAGDAISWNTHMMMTQGGSIGINESSPDDRLHVTDGGNGTRVRAENTGNGWAGFIAKNTLRELFIGLQGSADANPGEFHIFDNTTGAQRMVIDDLGNVGFGRPNPSVKLDVNGAVNCTGGTCSSDIRWKKNVQPLSNVLSKINKLNGVSYYWRTESFKDRKFEKAKQIGVIAQEVEKVYPELVKTDGEGYKSMDYMSLTAILLEGIKEQQREIEKLKAEVKRTNNFEARLKIMETMMTGKKESLEAKNK